MKSMIFAAASAATLLLASVGTATATDVLQQENGNAANTCTAALPRYDIGLRRRPLSITNEGSSGAFVNCAFRAPTNSFGQEDFAVRLRNYGSSDSVVSCTGVMGVADGNATYALKTMTVPAGGSVLAKWTYVDDNDNQRIQTNTGLQCLLAPGMAMTELPQTFRQK